MGRENNTEKENTMGGENAMGRDDEENREKMAFGQAEALVVSK